ncbi:MAG: DUF4258 domain-containing protein [Pyrinomonadaceae bacterium]
MYGKTLNRIKKKISEGLYYFSTHAIEELQKDDLTTDDAEFAIFNGVIINKLDHDIRGTRYIILGTTDAEKELEICCRIENSYVIIITCYAEFY